MKKYNENKGITLIALVVSIIVLLILAGISVSMLTGHNGILNRASEAKEKTEIASKDEQRRLAQVEALMSTVDTEYSGVTIPKGFAPTKIAGEDSIDVGLVITDGSGNEYVWVEVPKTTEIYSTAGTNIMNFTDEEYAKIEKDLHEYTSDYRHSDYSDVNSDFLKQYQNMLKSVYTNGGFWIGRYEAGISDGIPRTEHIDIRDSDKFVIKPNMIPYNYVTRDEAQELAKKMNYEDCTSSLIFGVQWDLMLKYIENKNNTVKEKLTVDSTFIGNYYNSEFTLNRGKFAQNNNFSNWYAFNSEEKVNLVMGNRKQKQSNENASILITTGATEASNLQGIYDIAGNLGEWTLEFNLESSPCVYRGGSYNSQGSVGPAKCHNGRNIDNSNFGIGFRVGLWK